MLRTPERDVQVHIWQAGSDDERRHLVFRDHLRSHPADREAYEALKVSLAGRWPTSTTTQKRRGRSLTGGRAC